MAVAANSLKDSDCHTLAEGRKEEDIVHKFVSEIYELQAASSLRNFWKGKVFNETTYARIVKRFNAAIMCTPHGEACSQLLRMLDRLEEQIFGDVADVGCSGVVGKHFDKCEDTSTTPHKSLLATCRNCGYYPERLEEFSRRSISETSFTGHQHPTTPVVSTLGKHRRSRSSQGSLSSATSLDFSSALLTQEDSFHSPEGSLAEVESCHSEPARKSGIFTPMSEEGRGGFRRTVRKLENAFGECSSVSTNKSTNSSSSSNVFRKLDFFNGQKIAFGGSAKKRSSAKEAGHAILSSLKLVKSHESTGKFVQASDVVKKAHTPDHAAARNKNGIVGPEVTCKPFMLARSNRHFTSDENLTIHPTGATKTTSKLVSDTLVKGTLQCVANDGAITYNLWLEDSEELIVAKATNGTSFEDTEMCDKVFMFYSYNYSNKANKGSCKSSGWLQWGGKKGSSKPLMELLGKMKVTSSVVPEMDRAGGGKHRHFVDSDFVLMESRFDKLAADSPRPKALAAGCSSCTSSRRLSFSSWDTSLTSSCESPRCMSSSSSDSPKLVAIPSSAATATASAAAADQRQKPASLVSPLLRRKKCYFQQNTTTPGRWGFLRSKQDDGVDDDVQSNAGGGYRFVEIAAIVTRIPIEIRKKDELDEDEKKKMGVTIVLPAGQHGCPAYGLSGPMPLLDRWKSGGKCDCGSWDLGCGLTLLQNHQHQDQSSIIISMQGKKQRRVMSLVPVYDDDTFALIFNAPLTSFQAFATAVAILHTRQSRCSNKKNNLQQQQKQQQQQHQQQIEEQKKNILGIIPVRSILHDALAGFPKVRKAYSLGCHPDSLSFVERV